jgi:spermidine synthase
LRSSENYISTELGQFLRSIHKTLRSVFPEVTAIPGETVHFFAAQRPGILASGSAELLARLHARNLETSYVSEYFIPFRMTPDRLLDLDAQIRPLAATPANHDFAPVAYYFDVALWSSQFHQTYRRLFRALAGAHFGVLLGVLGIALAALVVGGSLAGGRRRFTAGCCTAATGFTMIGLEMLLLLAFQAVYGYVYQQLAVVVAGFMGGMALGTWLALRRPALAGMRVLAATQVLAAAAPLVLLGLFAIIGRAEGTSRFVFPAMALICGMLGGFEFPVASRIFASGGTLYALDLGGSCLGAILFSAWFVPVFGFFKTALLSAMVSLAPAVLAMLAARALPPAWPHRTPRQ